MNAVIDTSVAVAWYLNESFSQPARDWQQRILAGKVHALVPTLHYLEFANVLRTYVRRHEMERALAEEIFALHLDAPLDAIEPHRASLLSTAFAFDSTVYDAAYISLAQSYDCPLVTAERTTTPWVVKLGKLAVTVG
jgi:predicted nucleic acid-binding protein